MDIALKEYPAFIPITFYIYQKRSIPLIFAELLQSICFFYECGCPHAIILLDSLGAPYNAFCRTCFNLKPKHEFDYCIQSWFSSGKRHQRSYCFDCAKTQRISWGAVTFRGSARL